MRVGIDISQIIYGTGVSEYTTSLVRNLLEIDSKNEYLLFGGSLRRIGELENFTKSLKGNFKTKFRRISPYLSDLLGNRIHYPKIEKIFGKMDIYHSSDWSQFASNAFNVTTVHDLAPIFLSKYTDPKIVEVHKRRLAWVGKEVDRIIVPSEATKNDLLKLKVIEERIKVIPEAVDPMYFPQKEDRINEVKKKYKIFGPYILAVGINFRKNTERIIASFSKVKSKELKLVITGHSYTKIEPERGVILTGHIPQVDLPALYSGAECLAYPSLYEGFGQPILEAFSCGCPVVTSNISSMPEVAGDAAVLVDPLDQESITEGIKKALRSKTGLSKKGFNQVKKFSWNDNAKQTLELYRQSLLK